MTLQLYQVRRWLIDGREFVVYQVGHWPDSVSVGRYADDSIVWATVEWMERGSEVLR